MKYHGISGLLDGLRNLDSERVSLEQILNGKDGGGPYFALFIMALLSLIPTPAPIPVISNFFGILCCLIAFQILLGKKSLIIPKFLGKISIKKQTLNSILGKIGPFFHRIEKITREHLNFSASKSISYMIDIFLLVISITMVAPIPLLTMIPTIAMMVTTFGLLNNDGLFVILGLLIGTLSVFLIIETLSYGLKLILKLTYSSTPLLE
ncbi:MAG: exopolysaccharide biosynthesis protein [Rickettsiales bacterium]|jgi:hypothetical protein|nr:exopolysaccharide biosynthesis protein [Rickettsiales bacterium]